MLSLTENLSKLEGIKITGFTDNSNFVEQDYAFISLSKNPKEALKYSKDAIDKGAKIVISQVNLHEHLKDKNLFDSNLDNHKDKLTKIAEEELEEKKEEKKEEKRRKRRNWSRAD